jgi:serine protease Do
MALTACRPDGDAPARPSATGGAALAAHRETPAAETFRRAVSLALPALVFVEVESAAESASTLSNPSDTPRPPAIGTGSGIILTPDGYILTNNHVVRDALTVVVVTSDGRRLDASVVGRDPNTDIAVLRVPAQGLSAARLGDSDSLLVGDWVLALGYPLGLSATVTAGIVSATARRLGILQGEVEATAPLEHFIQTDAAINPGNSGGPMVDLTGQVVGVNSALYSPTGFYAGYGFAVPINLARRVALDLIRSGKVERPRLGARFEDADPADAQVYHLPEVAGAEVVGVVRGGPAARAGLELGDVIVSVDGERATSVAHLEARIAEHRPGDLLRLGTIRYGLTVQRTVTLGSLAGPVPGGPPRPSAPGRGSLGFQVRRAAEGILVSRVDRYGAATRAGVRPGQRILAIDRKPVRSLRDLERVENGLRTATAVSLRVRDPVRGETMLNYLPLARLP